MCNLGETADSKRALAIKVHMVQLDLDRSDRNSCASGKQEESNYLTSSPTLQHVLEQEMFVFYIIAKQQKQTR